MKTLRKLWQLTALLLAVMPGMARATKTNNTTNTDHRLKQRKPGVPLALLLMLSVLTPGALAGNCMDDVSPLDGLVCTANDVRVAKYNVIEGPESVIAGEYINVTLQAELIATANERYDIGFFVALDGGNALNGSCFREFLLPPLCPRNDSPTCIHDPINGPFYNAEFEEDINDTCGDLEKGVTSYRNLTEITIIAQDSDGDGIADVGTCVSWDIQTSDGSANKPSCTCINDTLPGTKSKCRCENVRIGNIKVLGQIIVDKVTDPSEDPQSFEFTLTGTNNTDVSFNLTDQDAPFKSPGLENGTYNVTEFLPYYWDLTSVTCDDGSAPGAIELGPGEIVTCTFNNVRLLMPEPSINLIKTMTNNADEDISGDVSLGDTLTYTFNVTNDGNVNLTSVDVTDPMTGLSALSCGATSLAPNASMTCTATYTVTQADVDAGSIYNTATATGTPPIGENVTDTDDETVNILQDPSINITKTMTNNADEDGSEDVSLGDTLTYTFSVTNDGNVNLTSVDVTDPMTGLSAISCGATSLVPNESTTCTATYVVTQADVDAGWINNTATANGTPPIGGNVTDTDNETVNVPQDPSIDVVKTSDATGTNQVGDVITYTYTVTNDGDVTLTGVTVDDDLDGPVTLGVTTLAPGDSTTGTLTHTVTQADLNAGSRTNIADAEGTDPNDGTVIDQDTLTVPFAQNPSIDVEKYVSVDGGGTWEDADDLTGPFFICDTDPQFKFVVTNTGNVDLTGITLTDSDFDLSHCTVPSQLAVGASFECFVTDTWVVVQHTDTATVTGDFGGDQYSDEDDANYHYRAPSSQ